MRQIVFDTETTGFEAEGGDRIVEIGALEVINYIPTGRTYHQYINPERDIPAEVVAVHGIDNDKVKDEPIFSQIAEDFIKFIGNADLVAHNAEFDMRFINAEFKRIGLPVIPKHRVIDTLHIARTMFPGAPASLDALCRRFEIDNSSRVYHGALLDSELLAEVYLELSGGRQQGLNLAKNNTISGADNVARKTYAPREFPIAPDEKIAFDAMVAGIDNALWTKA